MGLLRRWLVWSLALALGMEARAWAVQAVLVADAHVNSALPGVNSGSISNLNVGGGYTALVQFDLSTLPAGTTAATIQKATLTLYCNRVTTSGLISLASVGAGWGEYSVTYSTLPAMGAPVQVASVSQAGSYITWDVTALVQGWVTTPTTNNGVALSAGTAAVQFDSKENDLTAHAATLEIALASQGPQGVAGPVGAMGPVGPAGVAGVAGAVGPMGPAGPKGDVGAPGPQGIAGPAGAMGPAGPQGATGAAGVAGPQGPQGPQGAAGLVYQGNYSSVTNYAAGDVVLWQGASYTSLSAGNHGNTPSSSPQAWGVLSAQGPAGVTGAQGPQGVAGPQGVPGSVGPNGPPGPQGLQGIPGQAGAQGIPGVQGIQGLQGPMGPQGVQGPVGMTFRGAYSAVVNYGAGDGVLYGGAGYVSLIGSNHGNSPDQSPGAWAMFATGTQGPAGQAGAAGVQGPAGPMGLQGPAGAAGATGATGPQGPAVANYTGNYASAVNYGLHDAVSYGGSTYVSLVAGNAGHTPDQSPAEWAVLAAQGPAGPQGAAGAPGATGAAGATGAMGPAGPQGPPISFRGGWLTGQSYAVGDVAGYGGSSYVALVANSGREPDVSPSYWGLLAQAGAAGPVGPAGPQGMQGPTGYAGPQGPAGATGAQGPQGATGPVGATGPQGAAGPTGATGAAGPVGMVYRGGYNAATNYGLNDAVSYAGSSYISIAGANQGNTPGTSPSAWSVLAAQGSAGAQGVAGGTGPQGPQGNTGAAGAPGAAGPAGPAGLAFRGAWSSSASYMVSDAAQFAGTTYYATASSTGLEPDLYPGAWSVLAAQGGAGATGPAGSAATVSVGTVTTGVAGSQASVTNSGSSSAAVLNFTIPQGAAGTSGGGGGSASGIGFASMYHAVSFNYTYYAVNNTNASAAESGMVLTWIPNACTATSLTVFSQQGNAITVKLRQGTPGSMADTALVCAVSPGATCTVTGSVPVAAGSFLDLAIAGASGNAAGVWTAVGCS